jgi:demethylmenaquinone methyltransferase/2-methoxy-6-polyprenyl-1,4-benzoquinol methylase
VVDDVREMFADIAQDYDRANRILSFGIDRRWRKTAVEAADVAKGSDVLDCATGTGDLAQAFKDEVGPTGRVVGLDFVERMVRLAQAKAGGDDVDLGLIVGDALRLPYADDSFDLASIAFGIRNVDDPVGCLQEMARAVKHEGRVVVLEFGTPEGLMSAPYRLYSRHILPRIGEWLTGNREAYEYLPESQAEFPDGEAFLELMEEAGVFGSCWSQQLTGGIAYVYVGEVAK